MNGIGWAVKELQRGSRVRRAGWNGKGMWLAHIPAAAWHVNLRQLHGDASEGITSLPWVGMKNADGQFVPWLCSQTDLLAIDWEIAE